MFQTLIDSDPVQRAINYYAELSGRDQLAVKGLAVFMLSVIVIFMLILPATQYNNSAQQHYREAVDTLNWMQANQSAFIGQQNQRAVRSEGQSLLGIANTTSKKFNLSFKRYEPVGDNGLSLQLEQTAFNRLIVWLELLDKRYGIQVKSIAVEHQDNKGLVNVRLVLQG